MKTVTLYEAKTQISTLLREVEAGETVTITRHGKPVAELHAVAAPAQKSLWGLAKAGSFYMAPDFNEPMEDFADYSPDTALSARVAEAPPRRR